MFKLALDAGHGINTPGKRCLKSLDPKETREWSLNSRIATKVQNILSQYKDIEILRVDDPTGNTDIPISGSNSRQNKANNWKADFYLSIHHNAGLNGKSGGGTEVYVYPNPGATTLDWQKRIYDDFMTIAPLPTKRSGGGTKQADFAVLRETSMPAVLIECGFMDSPTDVPKIITDAWASQAANALATSIIKKAGLSKKVVDPVGYLETPTETRLKGWAYNKINDDPVQVHIYGYKDGKQAFVFSDVKADLYRDDLKKANIGNGKHAFDYTYDLSKYGDGVYTLRAYAIGGTNPMLITERTLATTKNAERQAEEEAKKKSEEEAKKKAEEEAKKKVEEEKKKADIQNTINDLDPNDLTETQKNNIIKIVFDFIKNIISAILKKDE